MLFGEVQVGTELQFHCVALLGLDSVVPAVEQVGVGGVTAHVPVEAVYVPIEQSGLAAALQVLTLAPLNLPIVVPAGQVGVGGVTVHTPVEAL